MKPFPKPPNVGPLDPGEYVEVLRNTASVFDVIDHDAIDDELEKVLRYLQERYGPKPTPKGDK